MLQILRISQFVLIEELELELGQGLNVVTGETGAGKSILVNALQLVLGGRARSDLVRAGAEAATVEALFDLTDDPAALERLSQMGFSDDQVVLRRVVHENGRTHATVNGRLATATQIRELAAGLVDISSQHEHHSLVDPSTHLRWLDAFGRLDDQTARVGRAQAEVARLNALVEEAQATLRSATEREDLLRYQIGEIDAANPKAGELEALEEEAGRLRHNERLTAATAGAEAALTGRENNLCTQVFRLIGPLRELTRVDPALGDLASRLDNARLELEEAARDLGLYARGLKDDPGRLAELEERLHLLRRLSKKYGGTLETLLQRRDEARRELALLSTGEERLEGLRTERERALQEAAALARDLSERRRAQAERLGQAISAELSTLGMGEARVTVEVAPLDGRVGELQVDGARLSSTGLDRVEFLIAPNRGEEPRPLRRVASGGELSRSLLALKRVLSGLGPVGLYVFDEVDTGVGGAVAETIGRKLKEVAAHHQVLCITHLPQIAAFGDRHLFVHKEVVADRTRSGIRPLGEAEVVEEMARMLGGRVATAATLEAARDLLRVARQG